MKQNDYTNGEDNAGKNSSGLDTTVQNMKTEKEETINQTDFLWVQYIDVVFLHYYNTTM